MDGGQPPQGMQGMNSGFNVMPQVPMVVQMQSSNPQQQLMVMQQDLAPLDYEKIKSFLVNSSETQFNQWQISSSPIASVKKHGGG